MDILSLTKLSSAIEDLSARLATPSMDNVENEELFQREARFKANHDSSIYHVRYTEIFQPDGNNQIKVTASNHTGKEEQEWSINATVTPESDGSQVVSVSSLFMGLPIDPVDGLMEIEGIIEIGRGDVVGV
ncbi:hypothetical protein ACK32R_04080 [Aeromonas dhakensis]|jgi:hypothetical protein|uniref:hypothetical protein n=1 Tax=Aeromonas dhakensis TaxID=196024 RepID=UPI0039872C73